jgi:hypothetical protein
VAEPPWMVALRGDRFGTMQQISQRFKSVYDFARPENYQWLTGPSHALSALGTLVGMECSTVRALMHAMQRSSQTLRSQLWSSTTLCSHLMRKAWHPPPPPPCAPLTRTASDPLAPLPRSSHVPESASREYSLWRVGTGADRGAA